MEIHETPRRRTRRWTRRATTVAALAALVIPSAAWAGHQFTDVPNSNTFHADIDWMADNGVTKGCNPPANTKYCPGDNVTREQMAAFMHRLETEGVFLRADAKAADADEVDGLDSTDLLPRFAVIEYNLGAAGLEAQRGLDSWSRTGVGRYLLTFDRDVLDCAWTGTAGARNNAVYGGNVLAVVHLHSVAGQADTVRVQVRDENGNDVDRTFNVAVNC